MICLSTCVQFLKVKRSFSTLKRIKAYHIRNSTGNERLSALAVLSIHRDLGVDPDEDLDIMATKKSRKMNFQNCSTLISVILLTTNMYVRN